MSTAFTGAHLITGDGGDYDDATVKIEGNRIVVSDISLVRTGVVGVVQDGRVIRDDLGLMDELRAERRGAAATALA
jgi:hypothetical protein